MLNVMVCSYVRCLKTTYPLEKNVILLEHVKAHLYSLII